MTKRNYSNRLELIENGFIACWHNAQDLVKGAKNLMDNSLHAQALSLSVLALEELGKLLCIDGLLFARYDDHKTETFAKSLKSHSTKLLAMEMFPMLLGNIASVDPRFKTEPRFAQTVAISLHDLKERGNRVLAILKNGTFQDLDKWKQCGFYSQPRGNCFLKPSEVIKPDMAEAVYLLAWRASSTIGFLLKEGNLERYIAVARDYRSRLTEEDHHAIEELSERVFTELFTYNDDEGRHRMN